MAQNRDQAAGRRRGPGRQFRKGHSGNPGGRPKEIGHVKELAREHTVAAVKTLAEIMGNTEEPAAARARAAEALLNRAWGTPESTANVNLTNEPTTEQLIQIILGDPELAAIIGAKLHTPGETKH
jgi:Family of unknown function (DUF5681)